MVAEPVCIQEQVKGRKANADGTYTRQYEARVDGKSGTLTGTNRQNAIAEPIRGSAGGKTGLYTVPIETAELSNEYYHGDKDTSVFGKIDCLNKSNNNGQPAQGTRIYNTDNKFICLDAGSRKYIIDDYKPCFTDVNGKEITVYEVLNGLITIKGKQYPIKLADGYYIIRKLTVRECMRLQTVPEWYDFSVISNSQAYKCLGNGWTVDVIAHLIEATKNT